MEVWDDRAGELKRRLCEPPLSHIVAHDAGMIEPRPRWTLVPPVDFRQPLPPDCGSACGWVSWVERHERFRVFVTTAQGKSGASGRSGRSGSNWPWRHDCGL